MQVYGDNTVVVTGDIKIDAVIEGKPKLLNSRYTDVWIKRAPRAGRWWFGNRHRFPAQ